MLQRPVTHPVARRTPLDRRLAILRATPAGRRWLDAGAIALLAVAYYVAAKIGLRLAYLNGAVTALWPPVGVGIAALVRYGNRLWPGIVIGDLLVGDYSTPLGTVLGQTAGNTLEVLVAATLMRRLSQGRRPAMDRVGDVLALVAAGAVGTATSATFGATSLRLGDVIGAGEFGEVWRTWWLSDFSGALVVTPLLLTWATAVHTRLDRRRMLEALALVVALVLLAEVPSQRDVPYVVFPALLWAALRFGPPGAATALAIASGLTVWNTAHNAGPFVRASITDSLQSSQLFLAAAALTSLVLAAVTAERRRTAAALESNEERLRSVVHSMAEGLVVRDAAGRISDCNAAAERILGRPRDEMRGRRPEAVIDGVVDDDGAPVTPGRLLGDAALASATPEQGFEACIRRPDGRRRWVEISSAPILRPGGGPEGVVTTLGDITDRREAEQRLVASEQATRVLADEQAALRRIATLVAAAPPPAALFEHVTAEAGRLLGVASTGVVRYDDPRTATMVGTYTAPGTEGIALGASMALDGDTVVARVHRSGRTERVDSYEGVGGALAHRLRSLGFRTSIAAPVSVGGRLWGALVASTRERDGLPDDAERRLRDFADLVAQALANADARDALAASRARLVEVGDAERQRLERNLHDGAQQRLVALALQLRLVEARLGDPDAARTDLAGAREQLDSALSELRELARGIHPAVLTDRGLKAAVDALVNRAPVPVEVDGMPDERLAEPVETAAYYLIAEAVTNVAKYAHATHVAVSAHVEDGELRVLVDDDGIGGADPAHGTGLRGLGDRLEALHGRLHVDSPPGGGTHVSAAIPIA